MAFYKFACDPVMIELAASCTPSQNAARGVRKLRYCCWGLLNFNFMHYFLTAVSGGFVLTIPMLNLYFVNPPYYSPGSFVGRFCLRFLMMFVFRRFFLCGVCVERTIGGRCLDAGREYRQRPLTRDMLTNNIVKAGLSARKIRHLG